jgi:glycosyltransferase involved in cell wall biosynthesis
MTRSVSVVSAVDPYPVDAGKKVVLAGFLRYLVDRVGAENVHYLLIGGDGRDPGAPFPVALHRLPKPAAVTALGNVVLRSGTGRASIQESVLRSAQVRAAVARAHSAIAPTLEVYDTVRTAQYAVGQDNEQVCYLDDLFSERYRLMLAAASRYPGIDIRPLGNFATHVPRVLHGLTEHPRSQRALLSVEQRLVRRSEDRAAARFGRCLLVNERESALLRDRARVAQDRVLTVPPLVAGAGSGSRAATGADFVFLGLLSLPHNDDGLRSFLAEVWPGVLARRPNARLRVIGREPREELVRLAGGSGGSVTLEGYVPDLTALLDASTAMINPLRFGSGVKLKVIEALSRALPVVSTTAGADGIATGQDEGVLVADDADDLVDLLLDTADPRRNAELSEAARAHFARRYSPEAVYATYDGAFGLG